MGERLASCSAESFHKRAGEEIPEELKPALLPVLETIASLTQEIRRYDQRIEALASKRYLETELLRQVSGVGAVTALSYVLTLEEPGRFPSSRSVRAYVR